MIITANLITHQCIVLDYCVEATVRSMLDLCNFVYINDGKSTDGTLDVLYSLQREYGKDRVIVYERDWLHNRELWARERNFLLDNTPKDAYTICIDADEVFHENEIQLIRDKASQGVKAIAFPVIHFYGRPTHYIDGPAWYKQHTRMWHMGTGIRSYHIPGGCADDILWPNRAPAHLCGNEKCGAYIYHYGNCRDPKAIGMKSKKADDLYRGSEEYMEGKIAELRSFDYAFETVGVKEFKGTHPKYIKEWYDKHKSQETSYSAEDGQDNKLWCFS